MKKLAIGLLAITLTVCLAVPAMADFHPYASLRLITGWYDVDEEDTGLIDTTDDLFWELGNFSRFGAKFSSGDLSGHVEFGIKGDGRGANDTYDRLLYGTWKFGGGSLMIGQNYTPYTFISSQIAPRLDLDTNASRGGTDRDIDGENYFIGYGCLWDSRQPQIKVKLDNGFYVALIQPEADNEAGIAARINNVLGAGTVAAGDIDVDETIPKICVGYEFKTESLMLNPGFAFNTYEAEVDAAGLDDEDINCWLLYLNGRVALGPATIQGSLHYGQNLGDFGLWSREDAAYAQLEVDGDVEDSDCYGGYVQVAFPIDPATITLGVGYTQSENDEMYVFDQITGLAIRDDDEDEQMSYFIQAKYPVCDNFWVVPEFSYYDHMDDAAGQDEPTSWFAGLMWRMDF
ncbi:MAG: hypothetical protein KAV83_11810 [Desulfobacterales bacterium]|nr:hypothetical protein [Desulfobacterales bacterium]